MSLLLGTLLGLVYVVPPGPVNIETIRRGLRGGFPVALRVQLGALVGDALYAVLAVLGAGVLARLGLVHTLLGWAGTVLLLYLGWSALREGWQGVRPAASPGATPPPSAPATRRSFLAGVLLSLANPCAAAFWLALGGNGLVRLDRQPLVFLGSFFLGVLLWALLLPGLVQWGRTVLRATFFPYVALLCGLVLLGFGLALGRAMLP